MNCNQTLRLFVCQVLVLWLILDNGDAETFSGTNAPGNSSPFSFIIGPGVTNATLAVPNSTGTFSYVLLKYGGAPSDTDYDFVARFDGRTNAINLELPECVATNYGLMVRTPTNSLTHAFVVTLSTNVAGLRSATLPAMKLQAFTADGSLTSGEWHYFRVELPSNSPGWRLVLNSAGTGVSDLYVRKDNLPTTGAYTKRVTGQTNGTLILTGTEVTNCAWFVGVHQPGGTASYTLFSEVGYVRTLSWDPGTTHLGTEVFTSASLTNAGLTGGDYYFKINAQNTDVGAWRTALNVTNGEADIYMQGSWQPSTGSSWKSARVGSDGFVLHSSQYTVGQDWYLLVHASPGAQWNLVSGRAYVMDLGALATNTASSSGPIAIGAEGLRIFKTTVPAETLAWHLGLNGMSNTLYIKKSFAPHPVSYELKQDRQMLVVPDYLGGGSFNGSYFVGIPGNPGDIIDLDSRQQAVADLDFSGSTNVSVSGYGYTTYRVQVPVQQIAWQMKLTPVSGDSSLAVRRGKVPNEWNNDAFSEMSGLASDSITLVPPTLSDGTFYITVYGLGAHAFTLTGGNPVITDIAFTSSTVNDDPSRVGWRYYRVADIASQLGYLGWDLFLENQAVGTEIALRRNAVPGRWNYRQNNSSSVQVNSGHVDYSGIGFLQRPGHQADIWYVGVYMPTHALDSFTLVTRALTAESTAFDGTSTNIVNQPVGKWQYFRVDVPANVLGWDLRLTDVISGDPHLVVRRDQLPFDLSGSSPSSTNWPVGYQWAAGSDWTRRYYDSTGVTNQDGRILAMGMGNPLEPGTYYVGVINGSSSGNGTNPMSYTLLSQWIGDGLAIPVVQVPFAGGSEATNGVAPREAAYYRVAVPSNTPSWQVRLSPAVGEAMLKVQWQSLPRIEGSDNTPYSSGGAKVQKMGKEQWVLLPENGTNVIRAGTYYIAAVSEGQNATNSTRIGTGTCSWAFESFGAMGVSNLGTVSETDLVLPDTLEGGAAKAYQFTVPPGTLSVEVRLEDRVGNPMLKLVKGDRLPSIYYYIPYSSGYDSYGNYGGVYPSVYDFNVLTVANPTSGVYSLIVNASESTYNSGAFSNAAYSVRVHAVIPTVVAFDGGSSVVTNQSAGNWRFFVIDVPTNTLGWDIRIKDVISGDPHLVVRRDQLPFDLSGSSPSSTNWPVGHQWAAGSDWTRRYYDSTGVTNQDGRILAVGMGNPLEPGTYYVGVLNGSSSGNGTNAMIYTLLSRGIGDGLAIPVVEVPFAGGSGATNGVVPREAAYYQVVVPSNTPSWQVRLSPIVGEAMLKVQRQSLPRIDGSDNSPYSSGGAKVQKMGKEQWVLLPENGTNVIRAGTYYITTVSEGQNPVNINSIGTGTCSWAFESFGATSVNNLGTVSETDLVLPDTVEGGAAKAYQFTVPPGTLSVEVRLEDRVGNPELKLVKGDRLPSIYYYVTYQGGYDSYGNYGGVDPSMRDFNLLTVANPTSGVYSLIVYAADTSGVFSNAAYGVRVHAVIPTTVAFDTGSSAVTNQSAGNWRFFVIDVPTNALGWDIRIKDVVSGDPHLVVRRDQLPFDLSGYPLTSTNWPSGSQWAANYDWTRRSYDSTGVMNQDGQILAMGMGNPLEPGTYYVGVLNGSSSGSGTNEMSYTLLSRGIGEGFTLPVVDVPFAGGSGATNGVVPREAAYYRVVVPSNTPSWQARLSPTAGEALLTVQRQSLPCILNSWNLTPYSPGGVKMQKADKEQWVLLPESGTNVIRAGTYYIAAVSEGQNATNSTRIGTGASSWTWESFGAMGISNLGTVSETDLVLPDTLEGGAAKAYQFTVPPGTLSLEVRLEDRVGNPELELVKDDRLPGVCYYSYPRYYDSYGNYGGVAASMRAFDLLTMANPASGVYSLIVYASDTSGAFMDASYTLRARYPVPTDVNFSANLNTNGQTHVVSGTLVDNQRAFYKVIVPATNDGQAVVGWRLDLAQTQGSATVRVRKDLLPTDGAPGTTPFTALSALIVPPFLTPGTWYVEVCGSGATDYTLTSRMFDPAWLAWTMPLAGNPVTTPGLTAPEFGDTGTDTNGVPLPGDRGIDLGNGTFHYYVVNVPTNNAVLIRTMLEAISGNPDLYIRAGFPPTLSHDTSGNSGSIYERASTGTGTEYGNWVPLDGRYESWLTNGVWYFAVRAAGGANCRYRLHVSSGTMTNLALKGGSLGGQALAGGDWRYYRVEVPTNASANWNVTFSQQSGDVVMYVRDVSPPGNATSQTDYRHWDRDAYIGGGTYRKNDGPYGSYDPPGTYSFGVQPVRPGQTYYLGFRAVNDAIFSVSSTASNVFGNPVLVPFCNGYSSNVIPAHGVMIYQIDVPADASRWIHSSIHPASVQVYMEQGTLPYLDGTADWRSAGVANSSFNQMLNPSVWPWMPSQAYYMVATNTSAADQVFIITMSGPDLVPTSLGWTNTEAVAGKFLTVMGTVTNRGHDTALPTWYDDVYLSSNAVWDAQDVSLGAVSRSQSVAAGGSYRWTNTVTVSQWAPGSYYLILKADKNNNVFESDETNNTVVVPVTLTAPDLAPLNLVWTNEAVAGKSLTLMGTVTNLGNGTALPTWSDWLYLSSNATWDAQDTYLGNVTRSQPLAAGDSSAWTNTVTLSQWPPGNYYLIIKADDWFGGSYVFESNESNNVAAFPVTLTAPDLVPTALVWTNEAVAGKSVTLMGTVTNLGNGTALPNWSDYMYLSSNAVWDAQDISLGSVSRSQSVAVGGGYQWTNTVTLSQWLPGNYYLILKTDRDAAVFESNESNNATAFPVTLTAPDLAPTALVWTNEAVAGKSVTLMGTVSNLGNGTAVAGWYDNVYLSSNAVWDAQDTSLCSVNRGYLVAAGNSYIWTNTVTLSSWSPGAYYLIMKADNNGGVFEGNETNNDMAFPVTLTAPDLAPMNLVWTNEAVAGKSLTLVGTVTNQGNGTALASWSDYLYLSSNAVWDAQDPSLGSASRSQLLGAGGGYTWSNTVTLSSWQPGAYYLIVKADGGNAVFESDETNNTMAVPVTLTAPDLAPMNLMWTNEAVAGKALKLVGAVINQGNGTALPSWSDYVYLSSNTVWDAQDVNLGNVSRSQPVVAGGGYTWTNTVTLANWSPGTYYLIVKADAGSAVFESNETNNAVAFPVTLTAPDLAPTNLVWINEAVAGRSLTLVATVTNLGNGTALPNWSDYVYLSSNAVWDAQDIYLGNATRSQPVAAGGSYTWTNTVTLSSWSPGTYYLIVKTDNGNAVFESNETNNAVAFPVTLTAPDLAPTNLACVTDAVVGKPLTLVGTVTNLGSGTALPSWMDYVYLSSNTVWDAQDLYLGNATRSQPVAAGGSYTWTNTVTLSSWSPGTYYLIVKTDNGNAVFESNETNNAVAFAVNMMMSTPPTNDMFANRIPLSGLRVVTIGRNFDATSEAGEPAYVDRGRSVWWTWTAPFNGVVTNSTLGSSFDTVLGVYTGSTLATLGVIAQDDDGAGGGASRAIFNAVAGTRYHIAVDGFSGASGIIVLNLYAAGAPCFDSGMQISNGCLRLVVNPGCGITNEVQACTNLVNARWGVLTNIYGTGGPVEFMDANTSNYPSRFYRIAVP